MPTTNDKKYVSLAGLDAFYKKLKADLALENGASGKVLTVAYAASAGKAVSDDNNQNISDSYISDIKVLHNGASDYASLPKSDANPTGQYVELDLSGYALKTEIAAALNFKGAKTGAQLAALTAADVTNGDVYTCITSDSGIFHVGYEYAATLSGDPATLTWVELGKYLDLSGYANKVTSGTAGNLVDLVSDGNGKFDIHDSGIAASDIGAGVIAASGTGSDKTVTGATIANWATEANHIENVIESISVNGTAQTITNKGVDISVPVKTSAISSSDADGYASSAQVAAYVADTANVTQVYDASSAHVDTLTEASYTGTGNDIDSLFV